MSTNGNFSVLSIMLIFNLCVITSCNNECPEDEYYGEIKLTEQSISSLPYSEHEKVIFVNEIGKEIVYDLRNFKDSVRSYWEIPIGEICNRKKTSSNLYIESEIVYGGLFQENEIDDNSLNFSISINVGNENIENPYDTIFYDKLSIWSYLNNEYYPTLVPKQSRIELISSSRNSNTNNGNIGNVEFVENINLLNKEFLNVYLNNEPLKIYYNFEKGIIAFENIIGELWVFDRFE